MHLVLRISYKVPKIGLNPQNSKLQLNWSTTNCEINQWKTCQPFCLKLRLIIELSKRTEDFFLSGDEIYILTLFNWRQLMSPHNFCILSSLCVFFLPPSECIQVQYGSRSPCLHKQSILMANRKVVKKNPILKLEKEFFVSDLIGWGEVLAGGGCILPGPTLKSWWGGWPKSSWRCSCFTSRWT